MPLLVGGALLVLIALVALSGSSKAGKQSANTLLGAAAVCVAVVLLVRAGLVWLAAGVAFLWLTASRIGAGRGGAGGQSAGESAPRGRGGKRMTLEEAHQMLGLEPGASRERILAEYRRLMKKVHPDQGGTTYLAARLNEAKDVLLENAGAGPP